MKKVFFAILFLLISSVCFGQTVTSTSTVDKTSAKKGVVATVTTVLKNTSTAVPTLITASADYTDSADIPQTISSTCSFNIVHPANIGSIVVPTSGNMTYVANSAKLDGIATTASVGSQLTISVAKTLNDQDTCSVSYQFLIK